MSDRIRVKVVEGAKTQGSSAAPPNRLIIGSPPPTGAKVYLVYPKNGGVVQPETVVRLGLVGMGVAPAGVEKANTGHHHLLIDTPLPRRTSRSRTTSTTCISASYRRKQK
jgi:hypothetical protein